MNQKPIHRAQSLRIPRFDYSQPGYYFITICTKNREELFGTVENETLLPTSIGTAVEQSWTDIPIHFHHVELDKYVVMPNHIHGIIVIRNPVETRHVVSLLNAQNQFSQPISGSLSVIIQQYKSSVKRWCNKNNFESFSWQPNYYEHVIRNERSLERIREYIQNNPLKWELDIENSKCVKSDKRYYENIFDDTVLHSL